MAALKVQMARLEDALAAETKRRVDATTALDELARTQVYDMEQRLKEQLQEEHEKLHRRLGALERRVETLEQKWVRDSTDQIELVHNKAQDLAKVLEGIQYQQDAERKARLKREGSLLEQVERHAKEFEERWNQERNDRIERMNELENVIISHEARLAMEQKRYEERLDAELASLKREMEAEISERQVQDQAIVERIEAELTSLHRVVHMLNTME
jgi:hypothetical protein